MKPRRPPPPDWMLRLLIHPVRKQMASLMMKALFQLRAENQPNLPTSGPVIFAGNHGSHMDFLLLLEFLERQLQRPVRGLAWEGMAEIPVARVFYYAYRGVPVSPGQLSLTLRRMVQVLEEGYDLWVQCEGARHDELQVFHPGAALASLMSGCPIVPFTLRGVQPLFKNIPWPDRLWGRVSIRYHDLVFPEPYRQAHPKLRDAAQAMIEEVRRRVATAIDYPDALHPVGAAKVDQN